MSGDEGAGWPQPRQGEDEDEDKGRASPRLMGLRSLIVK